MAASALDTRKTPTEGSKDNEVRNEWFENPNSFVFSAIFLFKILAGIVSLSGGGAVATAHRFRYKTKKMKRDMDLEEITEPSLKIRRYFWNFFANVAPFVCMVIENGKIPQTRVYLCLIFA